MSSVTSEVTRRTPREAGRRGARAETPRAVWRVESEGKECKGRAALRPGGVRVFQASPPASAS